ncbi:unnamed protein product [Heterobilharzia americana]|nr:unnamed protein product [Heterobilharzia americana]
MSDTRHLNFELETSIDHSGSGSSSTTSETNTESKTQTSQRPHVSTWAYIKWFIWSTIANLFGCSIPVFTSPYDNTWPTTSILIEPTELDYKDSKLCEINDAAAADDDSGDVPAAQLSEVNAPMK